MFLNLENLEIKNKEYQKGFDGFSFFYKSTKYYFKYHKKTENFYNELIAEKIASRLNIPCCHYDLAYYLDDYGVVSKSFDHPNYISMKDYLVEKYSKDECDERNTLEDIWDAFFLDFKEENIMIERPIKNIIRNKFAKNREMINNYFQNRKTNQILKGMIK